MKRSREVRLSVRTLKSICYFQVLRQQEEIEILREELLRFEAQQKTTRDIQYSQRQIFQPGQQKFEENNRHDDNFRARNVSENLGDITNDINKSGRNISSSRNNEQIPKLHPLNSHMRAPSIHHIDTDRNDDHLQPPQQNVTSKDRMLESRRRSSSSLAQKLFPSPSSQQF